MKLLVVHPFAAVPVRQEFYSHVQSMTGWEITIVTPNRWKTEFGETLRARRSPQYRGSLLPLPIALPGQIPLHTFVGRIAPIIRRERPDVVYVYHEAYGTATFQAFLACIRAGGPPIGFYSSQNIAKRYLWPFAASERFVYRHASFAIVPARGAADVLRRKGYGQRIEEIPFEIDFDRFHTQGLSALERAELRSADDVLTVGYVGRLVPEKGVDTLLDALAALPRGKFRAMIAGTGSAAEGLRNRASELGIADQVSWLGYVPYADTPAVYRQCDVLVVPSRTVPRWKEQFGRVVIEAIACGTVVVASDSGELPRVIRATDGGWVFPEGDAQALASRLEALRQAPEALAERRRRSHATVVDRFHIDVVVRQFTEVIESVARSV